MRKIFLWLFVISIYFTNTYANMSQEEENTSTGQIIIPEEISWTDRFILTELKELRIGQEEVKREIYTELQNRQLETVDKALSYSANTVNFFFVFITIVVMWFWVVGWRTLWDIKKTTKESMDRETKKIISNFEKQIAELEKEQKINILWRQFNVADSDHEKMNILDRISYIKPDSQYVAIERWNVYLSMWLYEKVLEVTEPIVSGDRTKHQPHAFFNRTCAYYGLKNIDNMVIEMTYLLQLAPEYKDIILESEFLSPALTNPKVKKLLK